MLDMGQEPPRVFTPLAAEPPVEVRPEEFTQALAELQRICWKTLLLISSSLSCSGVGKSY